MRGDRAARTNTRTAATPSSLSDPRMATARPEAPPRPPPTIARSGRSRPWAPATGRVRAPARRGIRCTTWPGSRRSRPERPASRAPSRTEPAGGEPQGAQRAMRGQEIGAPDHPGPPVRSGQDVEEPLRPFEIDDQHDGGERDEDDRQDRRGEGHQRAVRIRATREQRRAASPRWRSP